LRELGLTRHRIEARAAAGRLRRLHRGVYAVGHEAITVEGRLLAAVLACGPAALASHRAAGGLHGLMGRGHIEVTAPRGCKGGAGIELHRSRSLTAADRTLADAVPVTTVARTLVDLADVLSERSLARAVRRAEELRVLDLRGLNEVQARVPGRRGRHRLGRVLAAYRAEPNFLRSEAERRLKLLCEEHGLPQPRFNTSVAGYEVDVYRPDARLALEFDGAETHLTRHAFHADRRRDRALAVEGVQTLRVTWPDLAAPLAHQVLAILRRR
jgi:very-short-patch-repair endonuclease